MLTFPVAFLAKGHPPRPDIELSTELTPIYKIIKEKVRESLEEKCKNQQEQIKQLQYQIKKQQEQICQQQDQIERQSEIVKEQSEIVGEKIIRFATYTDIRYRIIYCFKETLHFEAMPNFRYDTTPTKLCIDGGKNIVKIGFNFVNSTKPNAASNILLMYKGEESREILIQFFSRFSHELRSLQIDGFSNDGEQHYLSFFSSNDLKIK